MKLYIKILKEFLQYRWLMQGNYWGKQNFSKLLKKKEKWFKITDIPVKECRDHGIFFQSYKDNFSTYFAFACKEFVSFSLYFYFNPSWTSEMDLGKIRETTNHLNLGLQACPNRWPLLHDFCYLNTVWLDPTDSF